jgi:transposase
MITREQYYQLHVLHDSLQLNVAQLAEKLNISESSVRRWLKISEYSERSSRLLSGKLSNWHERIEHLLQQHNYSAMQLFQMISEAGYTGSYSTVKRYVKKVRPPRKKAFFKLNFSAGDAAQVDFGYCGTVPCGNTKRKLIVFVMVLCHSRYMYAEFIPCERTEHFLQCHFNAFKDFNGIPKRVIVDNCKCAVKHNKRHAEVVYNSQYLAFAKDCGFAPDACNPYSPNEKGIVENAVKYIKHNFVKGRDFNSLSEANFALHHWVDNTANIRIHAATERTPLEMLHEERDKFVKLPVNSPACSVVRQLKADTRCRIWFDTNSYSVPSKYAGQYLTLQAKPGVVQLYKNGLIAEHVRCYGRKTDIVDPDHLKELRQQRHKAKEQQLQHDFLNISPHAMEFLEKMQLRELDVQQHLRKIVVMAEQYGKKAVANVLEDMLQLNAFRAEYVEHRLMNSSLKEFTGTLHVPRAGDSMNIEITPPNLNVYN